jgi:small subunit ribosomal protein S8
MTDPIADMLTRIRNAAAAGKGDVVLPMSKIKYQIAKILEQEGWIQKCEEVTDGATNKAFKEIKLVLKYKKSGRPAITSIKRISKPGLRVYHGKDDFRKVLNGLGMAIVSTSQGMMTVKEAKKQKIGGEVICEIY